MKERKKGNMLVTTAKINASHSLSDTTTLEN